MITTTNEMKLLERPRIDSILDQAITHSLILTEAAYGYGKTEAISAYLKNRAHSYIWLSLSPMDNLSLAFWNNFIRTLDVHCEPLARQLEQLGFPDLPSKMDLFLHMYAHELLKKQSRILVIDDYALLNNEEILNFFEHFIAANLENHHMLFISSSKTSLHLTGLKHSISTFWIETRDLRFTAAEARDLFALYGIHLDQTQQDIVVREVDGFPLALNLLAAHAPTHSLVEGAPLKADLTIIYDLFEQEYFSGYSDDVQKILIQLSLIKKISLDSINILSNNNISKVEDELRSNMFISYDPYTSSYTYHKLYKSFLEQKQCRLSDDDVRTAYLAAADALYKSGSFLHAIEYYSKSGCYDQMLRLCWEFSGLYTNRTSSEFLLMLLNQIPEKICPDYPVIKYLKGCFYINLAEISQAEIILNELILELTNCSDDVSRKLLGNTFAMLGGVKMLHNMSDFPWYYKRAAELLPHGNTLRPKNQLIAGNVGPFYLDSNQAGALKKMEQAYNEAVPLIEHVFNGSGRGLNTLFTAEAAYLTYDLREARQKAYEAIYQAAEHDQHDILLTGRSVLLKAAMFSGDYEETVKQLTHIKSYIAERQLYALYHTVDCIESKFYINLGEPEKITPWILKDALSPSRPTLNLGKSGNTYAFYLLRKESFDELIAVLSRLKPICSERGSWQELLQLHIYRSIGYMKSKNNDSALNDLYTAYNMSHQNGIITPFIEMGSYMRSLIDLAKKSPQYDFDKEWLNNVYAKASTYAKRLNALMNAHSRMQKLPNTQDANIPTKRELEIIQALAQGLTQEEIADFYYVSINTVKTHIKNIYNKLGAINCADAIHIVTKMGLI